MNSIQTLQIVAMQSSDWPVVKEIYAQGLAGRNATFETNVPTWEHWDTNHLDTCRLVGKLDVTVVGWAALSAVSSRCVYAGVAEVSIYVATRAQGQGIGKQLLNTLVSASEQAHIWTLQAGIMANNTASVALHEKCGFRIVGYREKLGQLDGVWRDVILMERRSQVVG